MAKKGRSTTLVGDRGRRSIRFLLSNPWRTGWLAVFLVAVAVGGMQLYQYSYAISIEDEAKEKCGAYGVKASIDTAHCIARRVLMHNFGWNPDVQMDDLNNIYNHESGWRWNAINPIGARPAVAAYGIPQALPGSKMGSVYCAHGDGISPNYQVNATCQMRWGFGYIRDTYGTPHQAWNFWQAHGWY